MSSISEARLAELDKRTERFTHNAAYSSSMREPPVEVTQRELRELVVAALALRHQSSEGAGWVEWKGGKCPVDPMLLPRALQASDPTNAGGER
jgi:hypothetical protein